MYNHSRDMLIDVQSLMYVCVFLLQSAEALLSHEQVNKTNSSRNWTCGWIKTKGVSIFHPSKWMFQSIGTTHDVVLGANIEVTYCHF